MSRVLCRLDEIPDGEGRGFALDRDDAERLAGGAADMFVVRQGDRVFGYANACPHLASPLDWIENQFMTADKTRILCATHGAQFNIADGLCVAGPCEGDSLTPLRVSVRDGAVTLDGADVA
jgi:nitrite reductase/ring-hydroxylating ferredoxin subunit